MDKKKIKLLKTEFIGNENHPAGTVIEDLDPERARLLVRSGSAEYVNNDIEYAVDDEPKTKEIMAKKKPRRKKTEE